MAAGELGVWLTLRGRGEMVAGLREMQSGLRGVTRALRETSGQAVVADRGLARVYRREHLSGIGGMNRGLGSMHTGLSRLMGPLTSVGRLLGPLVGFAGVFGISAGLHAGVEEATKLQSALAQLQTEAGVKAGNLAGLGAGSKTIASQTGVRASTLASDALFHLEGTFNKEGRPLSNADALAMTRVIAQGSQVGGAPVDDVAKAFSGLSVTGIRGADGSPEQLMGKLISIVGAGGTMRMGDLANAVGSGLVPNLKALGLGLDDVGGALATMTDNGVPAETAIRTLTTSLMHVQKPTGQGAKMLAAIGLDSLDLATDLRKPNGLVTMIGDLGEHLDRLPGGRKGVQAQSVVAAIFGGTKGTGPLQLLLNQTANLTSNIDKVSHSSADTFTAAWAVTSRTFAVQKDRLVETARNAASGIGAALLPTLGRVTGRIADFITDASAPTKGDYSDRQDRGAVRDAPSMTAGARLGRALRDARAGNGTDALADLGLSGTALSATVGGLSDMRQILRDSGQILTASVLPAFHDIGTVLGGAILVGLHGLRDVTGFMSDHSTSTRLVLDGIVAVLAVNTVANGVSTLYRLTGNLMRLPKDVLRKLTPTLSGSATAVEGALGATPARPMYVAVVNGGLGAGAAGGAAGAEAKGAATVAAGAGAGAKAVAGAGGVGAPAAATARGALGIGAGGAGLVLGGIFAADQLGKLIYGQPPPGKLAGRNLTAYEETVAWLAANGSVVSPKDTKQLADMAASIASGVGLSTDAVVTKSQLFEAIVYPYQRKYPNGAPSAPSAPSYDTRRTRASGGPVSAGTLYRVNEQGAEMFMPTLPGTILSASATERMLAGGAAGGRGAVHVHPGAVVINAGGVGDEAALNRVADRAVDRLVTRISDAAARR